MDDGIPVLLENPSEHKRNTWTVFTDAPYYPPGFADRNKNGLPDLAISNPNGGSHLTVALTLLEIQENGNIIDIAPERGDLDILEFRDIDLDQVLEIYGFGNFCVEGYDCRQFQIARWFGWNGTAYVDISAEQAAFYQPENYIGYGYNSCPGYQALINYYVMDRLETGWDLMRDNCPLIVQLILEKWMDEEFK